ncbi:MAG: S1 family peptidase [Polyangiaceae bacterium]
MKRRLALLLVLASWQMACNGPASGPLSTTQPLLDGDRGKTPGVVAVRVERGGDRQLCTGVLLLPNLVLTARHCLTLPRIGLDETHCETSIIEPMLEDTRVTVIEAEDIDLATTEQRHDVTEALLPAATARLCGEDLALLRLARPVDIPTVVLSQESPNKDSTFTTAGYGLQSGNYGQQRVTTNAHVVCRGRECTDSRIVENEFLAESGACEGDSGGPALDADGKVFAILSRSTANCEQSAYLQFSKHFDWLATVVREIQSGSDVPLPAWAKAPPTDSPSDTPPDNDKDSDDDSSDGRARRRSARSPGRRRLRHFRPLAGTNARFSFWRSWVSSRFAASWKANADGNGDVSGQRSAVSRQPSAVSALKPDT